MAPRSKATATATASAIADNGTEWCGREGDASPELAAELREGIAQLERGEYIELTPEMMDHWEKTGEFPWSEESLG